MNIGDLNWFPTQKATYLANRNANVQTLEGLAGQVVQTVLDTTAEAEKGTVASPAAVQSTPGLTYYDYGGSGSITWTFNVTNAGLYDTKWYVHMTGRGQSGPVLGIDGHDFVDRHLGWGQFVFDPTQGPAQGLSNNAWVWVPIVADSVELTNPFGASATALFTLAAGTHTIGVMGGGWGDVRFAGIDLVKHGATDTMKLRAPDAVPLLVTPGAVGVVWVASGFKYVNLGANGSVTVNVTAKDHLERLSCTDIRSEYYWLGGDLDS